jgi:NADH-quinone oxidoreductase subunit N
MYGAVNLGAFAVVAHIGRAGGANRLRDYRGLWTHHPAAALALAFLLLCLAGLPPGVIGLFAKVAVFRTAVDGGLGWLAVLMAVNVVIGLFYYLRWTALAFRPPAPESTNAPARLPAPLATGLALTTATGVALSLQPELVLALTTGGLR